MSKRARTGEVVAETTVVRRAPRRPIDKNLINIALATVTNTQIQTTLKTTTFPCTVTGVRWEISVIAGAATTNPSLCAWAIVKLRDGNTANGLGGSDGADFYAPEQDVIVWGKKHIAPDDTHGGPSHFGGTTKIMRKMMGGDVLAFIVVGTSGIPFDVNGTVQFFCMT